MKNKQTKEVYKFATFRLDVNKRRLTCGGDVVPLTPKEFDVLLFLIENAERVVEKNELLEHVWKDTFVEEGTLTRNISWLRKKLAEYDADKTKIIETVPKRGYHFLPEVVKSREDFLVVEEQTVQQIPIEEIVENEPDIDGDATSEIKPAAILGEIYKELPAAPVKRYFSPVWIIAVVMFFAVLTFAAYRGYFFSQPTKVLLVSKVAPFSSLPGRENSPAFSPDGKQLAFAWNGGIENRNFDIYVKLIGAGEPVRLTNTEAEEVNPVFSPDGKSIAFVRVFPRHNEIILIPALGGAESKIYERASYASISFSPDGKSLAAAELDLSSNETGIFAVNLQTGEKKRLTAPDAPAVDHTPRFSPDGKYLAFIRYFSSFRREIFVIPATGGDARQVTSDDARIYGLAWHSDSESLYFTSYRASNQLNLWRISLNNNEIPQMLSIGSSNLQDLAVSPNGKIVAFVEEIADDNIWEILPDQPPRPFVRSTRADHSQQFSPDGNQIVFASDRTGNYEIWLADADGKNQRQLTDSQSSKGSPRFSPDGKFITYDAQIAGGSDIYIISVNGGAPRRLTETGKNNSLPAWSIDGNWIFFVSNRSGDEQMWKMATIGGEAVQITGQGAFEMFAAPDGKHIIYSKGAGKTGLWSVNTNGGDEKPIPELVEAGAWRSWSVTPNGVFYTLFMNQSPFQIKFYDFTTRHTHRVAVVDKTPPNYYANLTASSDGNRILYARQDQSASSIILADLAE